MKDRIRPIVALCLAFALALLGAATAAPHPMSAGGMTIEICADDGARTITVDANGNPVEPGQDCLDCVFCLAADKVAMAPSDATADAPVTWRAAQPSPLRRHRPMSQALWPQPRGPPARHDASLSPAAAAAGRDVAADGVGRLEISQVSCPSAMQDDGQSFEDARS